MIVAKVVGEQSEMGRSTTDVLCSCGRVNRVYRWSWAGHGKFICRRCLASVQYRTLEIIPKAVKERASEQGGGETL